MALIPQSVSTAISRTTPSNEDSDVLIDSPIVVVFSKEMASASLNKNNILLFKGSKNVSVNLEYKAKNRTLTIKPEAPLETDTTYKLKIVSKESGISITSGDYFGSDYICYFTTEKSLSSELPLEPSPIDPAPVDPPVVENPGDKVEPVPPVVPESPDFFPIQNLILLDSYPIRNSIVSDLERIGLKFNLPITKENGWLNFFSLAEKSNSFIQEMMGVSNKIALAEDELHSDEKNIILKPASVLEKGKQYELSISPELYSKADKTIKLTIPQKISFQIKWKEFYVEVEDVRLAMGLFGEAYTDSELGRLIHQQSMGLLQRMILNKDFKESEWEIKVPYIASQYVLYKTAYQAMLGQVIETSSGMKKSISLSDLSVSESSSVSEEMVSLLDLYLKEIERTWDLLNGIDTVEGKVNWARVPSFSTKGIANEPYPDFMERVPFKELGG